MSAESKTKCPYCDHILNKKPRKSEICEFCGNTYYVKNRILLTSDEIDIQEWLNRLSFLDLSRKQFDENRKSLSIQLGHEVPVREVIWRILYQSLSTPDHARLSAVYHTLAGLAKEEEKDPKEFIRLALQHGLLNIKDGGFYEKITIHTMNDQSVCPGCRELNGKCIDLEQALKELPVPSACTNESGCRCFYTPHTRLSVWRIPIFFLY